MRCVCQLPCGAWYSASNVYVVLSVVRSVSFAVCCVVVVACGLLYVVWYLLCVMCDLCVGAWCTLCVFVSFVCYVVLRVGGGVICAAVCVLCNAWCVMCAVSRVMHAVCCLWFAVRRWTFDV